MKYRIIPTADGSRTLYLPQIDEQYHSLNGAVTESVHVFIDKGYIFQSEREAIVFEVGLGTGLNCLLTAIRAEELKRPTTYYSLEAYPLPSEIIIQLNYGSLESGKYAGVYSKIHECPWGRFVNLSPWFRLYKIKADLTRDGWQPPGCCNIIYFDAFGPGKQPEMWSPAIFSAIYDITLPGGVFVTYSARGEVRRSLSSAGFSMERLPGPPGKKEMLRGIKVKSIS
ncbi:MAG: tRNA (5-methylaminomethyl-2-thiouridine)(34)-methyltransferase MnmD [Prolixibacteraceae bacterium]|nr:tRNA (5-methylaminomethyl-2-thiouridine)(34)-methyltransferase MnmD [Prolixibacteraceae bacterium]